MLSQIHERPQKDFNNMFCGITLRSFIARVKNRRLEVICLITFLIIVLLIISLRKEHRYSVIVTTDPSQFHSVYYHEVVPIVSDKSKKTIVLLSDTSFTSNNWVANGVLKELSTNGHRAIAVDIVSPRDKIMDNSEAGLVLLRFLSVMKITQYVLIVPPSSCSYALPVLVRGESGLTHFIVISPSGTSEFSPVEFSLVSVNVLAIFGKHDKTYEPSMNDLKLIQKIKTLKLDIDDAKYIFEYTSKEFIKVILNFIDKIK